MKKPDDSLKTVHIKDFEPIPQDLLNVFPEGLIKKHFIVAVSKKNDRILAVVPQLEGIIKPDGLKMVAGCPVDLMVAPVDEIIEFIKDHYGVAGLINLPEIEKKKEPLAETIKLVMPVSIPEKSSISPFIEKFIIGGIKNRVSEIILEYKNKKVYVRHRIHGVLIADPRFQISEEESKRLIQDIENICSIEKEIDFEWGEAKINIEHDKNNWHVNFCLNKTRSYTLLTVALTLRENKILDWNDWGMGPHQSRVVEDMLKKTRGVILFVGEECDDIDSTLNACAQNLATAERHVMAVGTEFDSSCEQFEQLVSPHDKAQFSKMIKLAFKHKPDVLRVNPIVNKDDLELCFHESLKGHLIIGRIFGRDSIDVIMRLISMGVPPYLIGAGLIGIVAQRKLRLLCSVCQDKDHVSREQLKELAIPVAMQPASFYFGKGCEQCFRTGFDKEMNIFEILQMDDDMRVHLNQDLKKEDMKSMFKNSGLMTLRQIAVHKAINGQTSLAEVLRVTL
ncbi:MAG: GspE/PulE family protein [Elusimicrobiota bacterium]